jgi:hypothetical protein
MAREKPKLTASEPTNCTDAVAIIRRRDARRDGRSGGFSLREAFGVERSPCPLHPALMGVSWHGPPAQSPVAEEIRESVNPGFCPERSPCPSNSHQLQFSEKIRIHHTGSSSMFPHVHSEGARVNHACMRSQGEQHDASWSVRGDGGNRGDGASQAAQRNVGAGNPEPSIEAK